MSVKYRTTRFSGADWADNLKEITLVGCGGIGSWTAFNLSRIGHELTLLDGDMVDETNVHGGQMFHTKQIGKSKVDAIYETCRLFGAVSSIFPYPDMYEKDMGVGKIAITGLDNMLARKLVFEDWVKDHGGDPQALFIDGRLLMETAEIFTVKGNDPYAIAEYSSKWIVDDSSIPDQDCTTKQSTFAAMIIAGMITATLCNFLTNEKLGMEMRDVPFHQKFFLPILKYETHLPFPVEQSEESLVNA